MAKTPLQGHGENETIKAMASTRSSRPWRILDYQGHGVNAASRPWRNRIKRLLRPWRKRDYQGYSEITNLSFLSSFVGFNIARINEPIRRLIENGQLSGGTRYLSRIKFGFSTFEISECLHLVKIVLKLSACTACIGSGRLLIRILLKLIITFDLDNLKMIVPIICGWQT
jgi:hypothetical protein